MKLEIATKRKQKMRLALMGKAGSGKTYSALLLAYGLCGDWRKIAIIDTEDKSASLYSHLGAYNTIEINSPFHPSMFMEAVDLAQSSNKEVIIIDSLSAEWIGEGGVHQWMNDPSWKEVIHEHRQLLSQITSARCHIICTVRIRQKLAKFDTSKRGFWNIIDLPVQQEGIEYPFTTVLRLDSHHAAQVVKDRTDVFNGTHPVQLTPFHGGMLAEWCNNGMSEVPSQLQQKIDACNTCNELQRLLFEENIDDVDQLEAFTKRRLEIESASLHIFSNDDQPRPAA